MRSNISRRQFLTSAALAGTVAPLLQTPLIARNKTADNEILKVNVFSKHLQFLNYQDMSQVAKEIGFDGIDLTIRPKGHVLPENVETDLPRAVEAMKKAGFSPNMFCTAVEDAKNPVDKKLLETAAAQGFKYYRMNWYRYGKEKTIPEYIQQYQEKITDLSYLNKKLGLVGCYQNHAGRMVGASLWEIWEILQKANQSTMGAQYDIRHATLEGGLSWQTGFELIQPHIKTIVIKDFMWDKTNGKWGPKNVPLGEGMVDFKTYFKLLKTAGINVPLCLHFEYPLGGADQGADKITIDPKVVYDSMKRDLNRLKELWAEA